MYIEKTPFFCHTSIAKKEEDKLDAIELLIFLRDNPLPESEEDRTAILTTLSQTELFIIYEDVCSYSPSFAARYTSDYVKTLLRKYNIRGLNLYKEITQSDMSEEDKQLLYFFFKGKAE